MADLQITSIQGVYLHPERGHYQVAATVDGEAFRFIVRRTLPAGVSIGTGLPEHAHLRGAELVATWTDAAARRLLADKRLGYSEFAELERRVRAELERARGMDCLDRERVNLDRARSIYGDPVNGAREPDSSRAIAALLAEHRRLHDGRSRTGMLLRTTSDMDGWHDRLRAEIEAVAPRLAAIDAEVAGLRGG